VPDLIPHVDPQKPYERKRWTQRHRLVVSLWLAGARNKQIASVMGYDEATVSIILNDPRAEMEIEAMGSSMAERMTDTHLRLKVLANEALSEITDEMRDKDTPVAIRQRAAFGILDRAGYTAVQKHVQANVEIPLEIADRVEKVLNEIQGADADRFDYEVIEGQWKDLDDEVDEEEIDD